VNPVEFAVQDALRALADESGHAPPPSALAGPALRGARRTRTRRRVSASTAAVLSMIVMVGAAYLNAPTRTPERFGAPEPPAVAQPSEQAPAATFLTEPGPPADLTGGWKVLAGPHPDGGTIVYDRMHRRYRHLPDPRVSVAPAGSLTAWFDNWGRLHLLDLAGGPEHPVAGAPPSAYGPPSLNWTPDGTRFLYTGMSNSGPVTVLVDALGRTTRTVGEPFECAQRCEASWSPRHTEVYVPAPKGNLRTYGADDGVYLGERGGDGSYPASPHADSEWGSLWRKPDGRVVVRRGAKVVDGPCADPFGGYWAGPARLLCVEEEGLAVRELDRGTVTPVPYPAFIRGNGESTLLGRG